MKKDVRKFSSLKSKWWRFLNIVDSKIIFHLPSFLLFRIVSNRRIVMLKKFDLEIFSDLHVLGLPDS